MTISHDIILLPLIRFSSPPPFPLVIPLTGGALEQIHIFALSHILRRPIIVYGVKYIKNYRDEPIGIANFQGRGQKLLATGHHIFRGHPVIFQSGCSVFASSLS